MSRDFETISIARIRVAGREKFSPLSSRPRRLLVHRLNLVVGRSINPIIGKMWRFRNNHSKLVPLCVLGEERGVGNLVQSRPFVYWPFKLTDERLNEKRLSYMTFFLPFSLSSIKKF